MPMGLPLLSLLSLRQKQTDEEREGDSYRDWRKKEGVYIKSGGGGYKGVTSTKKQVQNNC